MFWLNNNGGFKLNQILVVTAAIATLSLTMLQNVFCWGALSDNQRVKSEEKTKRLSVAGAAKGIEIFFGGVLQVSILLKNIEA